MKKPNTTTNGQPFGQDKIAQVWIKASTRQGVDPKTTRFDCTGRQITYGEYGRLTQTGWEIDHIKPVAKGGSDDLSNLQPLQWQVNRAKGDQYPWRP